MPNGQTGEPVVITKPKSLFDNKKRITLAIVALSIVTIVTIVFLSYLGLIPLSRFLTKQVIAEVNGEKIYSDELEDVKGLFSYLRAKDPKSPEIKTEALNFVIDRRLLDKEAKKRGLDVSEVVNKRYEASIRQYGNQQKLAETVQTNLSTYKIYLFDQAIREKLALSAVKWSTVDYLSIRYLWNSIPESEEQDFKQIASKKIQDYYQKIKSGLDIREAIKQRCLDSKINFFPFMEHRKIYTTTFNGQTCWEQQIGITVSHNTNPEWGDDWLKEVFKLAKGEISPVITLEKPAVGIYFIVKVLDQGGDNVLSIGQLMDNLRTANSIKIYLK